MKPMLRDEATGKLRDLAPEAVGRVEAAASKQVSDVAKIQSARLEQAMVTQRRWTPEDFERFIVRHPLQRHLAKLLVWRSGEHARSASRTSSTTPTPTTSRSRSTARSASCTRSSSPMPSAPPGASSWPTTRSSRRSRSSAAPCSTCSTRSAARSSSPASSTARSRRPRSCGCSRTLGWQRGTPQDGGVFYLHAKPFPSIGMTAVVEYDGVPVGYMVDWDDQSIERAYVVAGLVTPDTLDFGSRWRKGDKRLKWRDVDPIVRSEVLADIRRRSWRRPK